MGAWSSDRWENKVRTNSNRHESITDYDPYTGEVVHTNTQAEMNAYKQRRKSQYEQNELNSKLRMYDAEAGKYKDQLLNLFASRADRAAAQQVGGAAMGIQRATIRGGLEGGGLTQALLSRERSGIMSQAQTGKMDFSQKLLGYMQESRDRVVTGEIDYFNEIEKMRVSEQLQERFARFQAKLAQDDFSRQAFISMLGSIGQIGEMFLNPVAAPAQAIFSAQDQINQVRNQYGTPPFNPSMRY